MAHRAPSDSGDHGGAAVLGGGARPISRVGKGERVARSTGTARPRCADHPRSDVTQPGGPLPGRRRMGGQIAQRLDWVHRHRRDSTIASRCERARRDRRGPPHLLRAAGSRGRAHGGNHCGSRSPRACCAPLSDKPERRQDRGYPGGVRGAGGQLRPRPGMVGVGRARWPRLRRPLPDRAPHGSHHRCAGAFPAVSCPAARRRHRSWLALRRELGRDTGIG